MDLRFPFAAVSALALTIGAAQADNNFANVVQDGTTNDGVVTQGPGSHNQVGTAADAASQNGGGNSLDILQSGNRNEVGTQGQGFDQKGNHNNASITQSSDRNTVDEVQQVDKVKSGTVARNTLTVIQQGGNNNSVGTVWQTRTSGLFNGQAGNQATITQGGDTAGGNNHVGLLSQEGNRNDAEIIQSTSRNGIVQLSQSGSQDKATLFQRGGNGNKVGTIDQDGNRNTANLDFAGARNGAQGFDLGRPGAAAFDDLPQGDVRQKGLSNVLNFTVTGDATAFGFDQNGASNDILATVHGNANQIGVRQGGAANRTEIQITSGNRNDVFVTQADSLLGNAAHVTIGGDRNGVGVAQTGNRNDATVDIDGNANLVSLTQASLLLGNKATVGIQGNRNGVDLSQTGTNTASVIFNGNNNHLDALQSKTGIGGSGNTLAVTLYGNNNNAPGLGGFTDPLLADVGLGQAIVGSSFGPGTIYQSGKGNSISIDVGSASAVSNNNRFAMVQKGDGNGILGSINGVGNQVLVVQSGNSNFTSFTQIGNFNIAGVSQ